MKTIIKEKTSTKALWSINTIKKNKSHTAPWNENFDYLCHLEPTT